jgi:hypothetical protein
MSELIFDPEEMGGSPAWVKDGNNHQVEIGTLFPTGVTSEPASGKIRRVDMASANCGPGAVSGNSITVYAKQVGTVPGAGDGPILAYSEVENLRTDNNYNAVGVPGEGPSTAPSGTTHFGDLFLNRRMQVWVNYTLAASATNPSIRLDLWEQDSL